MRAAYASSDDAEELDVKYDILSNERRRVVMHILNRDGEGEIRSLSEEIAARQLGKDEDEEVSAKERKRVYIALYQSHLPKMYEAGIVEYDKERGFVEKGPAFDVAYQHLEDREKWHLAYLVTGAVGLVLATLSALVAPGVAVPVSFMGLSAMLAVAVMQYRS